MVDYEEILDSEIDPESPGTTSLFFRLRDNPIAIIEGAAGAPRATSKIITPGGSDVDGPFTDLTALGSAPGYHEFSSVVSTTAKTFPWITMMRVNGDVSITNTWTFRRPLYSSVSQLNQQAILNIFDGLAGVEGTAGASAMGGSGGAIGDGGDGGIGPSPGGAGSILPVAFSGTLRSWLRRRVLVGGNGPAGDSKGGGCCIIIVNGDMTITGTIDCSGEDGTNTGDGAGGAGGGSILIFCNGTLTRTGATFDASGGNGWNGAASEDGGGGGGGLIGLFAKAFAGSAATRNVAGGTSAAGDDGDAGYDIGEITLSEEIINSLLLGAVA